MKRSTKKEIVNALNYRIQKLRYCVEDKQRMIDVFTDEELRKIDVIELLEQEERELQNMKTMLRECELAKLEFVEEVV